MSYLGKTRSCMTILFSASALWVGSLNEFPQRRRWRKGSKNKHVRQEGRKARKSCAWVGYCLGGWASGPAGTLWNAISSRDKKVMLFILHRWRPLRGVFALKYFFFTPEVDIGFSGKAFRRSSMKAEGMEQPTGHWQYFPASVIVCGTQHLLSRYFFQCKEKGREDGRDMNNPNLIRKAIFGYPSAISKRRSKIKDSVLKVVFYSWCRSPS